MSAHGALRAAFLGLKAVASCIVIAALVITVTIGVVGIVFSGDLAAFRQQGVGLGLFSAAVLGIVGALGVSYRGAICQPQDATAVALAVAAGALAARMGGADAATLYATVAMLIALTSLTAGAAFFLTGRLRLGALAQFMPHPVMGGFLAATGMLLLKGAVEMAAPGLSLLEGSGAARAGVALASGAAMVVAARVTADSRVVPACFALLGASFYAWLWGSGLSLEDASDAGLLLGPFQDGGFAGAFDVGVIAKADYSQLWCAAPTMALVAFLAVVGAMLNASALALATGTAVDIDRDLRALGLANAAAALGGGLVGYHIFGETLLARRFTGADARWIGVGVALICGAAFIWGAAVLSVLQVSVFAAAIAYLGFDLLYQWLWIERRRMPLEDCAVVALILAVAAIVGFLEAIGVGVLAAAVIFAVGYARHDPILRIAPATSHQSIVEHEEGVARTVGEAMRATKVVTLTGYLFFGAAERILARLSSLIAEDDDETTTLILDMRRVKGVDASAGFALRRLAALAQDRSRQILVVDAHPALRRKLERMGILADAWRFATLGDALLALEDQALSALAPCPDRGADLAARLARPSPVTCRPWLQAPERIPTGHALFAEGDASDCLLFLERGRLSAHRMLEDGREIRVAVFLPGAIVGEIGLYAQSPRTASVRADQDSVVLRLTRANYAALSQAEPDLASALHAAVARTLARRLTRSVARVREISR